MKEKVGATKEVLSRAPHSGLTNPDSSGIDAIFNDLLVIYLSYLCQVLVANRNREVPAEQGVIAKTEVR